MVRDRRLIIIAARCSQPFAYSCCIVCAILMQAESSIVDDVRIAAEDVFYRGRPCSV